MYKTISVLVALALVAVVAPGMQADETSYADRNIEWLLETYPEFEDFPQEALDEFGERSERADLSVVMAGADHPGAANYAGDVWVLGSTAGCPADNVIAPGTGQFVPADPQLWLYPDPVQDVGASGFITVVSWTTKEIGFHSSFHTLGVTDNWCFEFFGIGLYFAFANAIVAAN